ncbi:MAG TPA: ABC transporter permease [Thermoanaerobaculia bacterium]|nr:ABC transporter permease [Thermoanaerobaculia bacterium]
MRDLLRHPGHAAAAILTLALGIGATTAIFSVVDAVLLRPLPFPAPERLADVLAVRPARGEERVAITPADFLAWRAQSSSFEHLGAYVSFGTLDWTGGEEPLRLSRHLVSVGLLEALGVRPAAGRLFAPEEYRPGRDRVVLLSHRLWRERFGGSPSVAGRSITLGGEAYQVAGVLPADFRIRGGAPDLLIPLVFGPEAGTDRESAYLGAIGRLKPGITPERAGRELDAIRARLETDLPEAERGVRASVVPLREAFAGPVRPALLVLFGAVLFVLLIACANVASLQLVRAAAREPEIVLRAALGADRRRLVRQLLAESLALAVPGGIAGVALAGLALRLLPDARGVYLPTDVEIAIDPRVLGFSLGLSLLTGLVSGLVPAFRAARPDLRAALRAGTRDDGGRTRWLDAFAVSEIALALLLLVGAGLMVHSFVRLLGVDPGFAAENVLTLEIELPAARYAEPERIAAFYAQLLERISHLPGVVAAGAVRQLPPDSSWSFQPVLEGQEKPSEEASAAWDLATPDAFAALGTPILHGRPFDARDRPDTPLVAVIDEAAARRFFPGVDPLGRRVRFNGQWHEIVGVAKEQRRPGASAEGEPVFWFAAAQLPVPADYLRSMGIAVRTGKDPLALAAAVRRELRALDGDLPAGELQTLEHRLAGSVFYARSHFNTVLLLLFGGLGLALAMIGIYGVVSYGAGRRTREIGIRMALGALRSDVVRLVLRHGLALTGIGLVLGLCGAVALARVLASLLYGIGALDPLTLGAVVLTLTAVATLASWIPAHRASRLDPLVAIRAE